MGTLSEQDKLSRECPVKLRWDNLENLEEKGSVSGSRSLSLSSVIEIDSRSGVRIVKNWISAELQWGREKKCEEKLNFVNGTVLLDSAREVRARREAGVAMEIFATCFRIAIVDS